jgi:hypothetical protein
VKEEEKKREGEREGIRIVYKVLFYLNKHFFFYISHLLSQHTYGIENQMMMAEPMTQMFKSLNTNSKKMYKKQKDVNSDISSICSSKVSLEKLLN